MSSSNDLISRQAVSKLRRRNFKSNLTSKMNMLGYAVIILQYIKFGSSVVPLILRLLLQSFLASPFPDNALLLRAIQRLHEDDSATASSNNSTDGNTYNNTDPNLEVNMPGGFVNFTNTEPSLRSVLPEEIELNHEERLITMKNKIRNTLFFLCVPLNGILLLLHIFSPYDFTVGEPDNMIDVSFGGKLGSQFTYGSGLIEGERRSGISIQMVGELIPRSNFAGNMGNVWFDFMILTLQLTLFTITCINFAELGYSDPTEITQIDSDGYDGKMVITRIDFNNIIKDISF